MSKILQGAKYKGKTDYADCLRLLCNHGRQGKYDHEFNGYNVRFNSIVQTPPARELATPVYHMDVVRAEKRDDLQKFLKEKTSSPAHIIRNRTISNRRSSVCFRIFPNCRTWKMR